MDALRLFALDQRRRNLTPRTIENRRRTLSSFQAHLGRGILTATPEEIEGWLDGLGLTPRSRFTYLSTLRSFYRWARKAGLVEVDPAEDLASPRLPRLRPRPMTDDDLAWALRNADDRMRAWLTLIAYQGFRCKEIAALRRDDVLESHTPPLIAVQEGKGGHQAILPLSEDCEMALRAYGLARRGLMFLSRDGRPFKPGTVSAYVSRFLRGIGVDASAHMGRHWYGTAVWAKTKNILVTQKLLRHADAKTSAGYIDFDDSEATAAIRGLRVKQQFGQGQLL